jgi:hypothetical protein
MQQTNPPAGAVPPVGGTPAGATPPPAAVPAKPKKKKRHLILKTLAVLAIIVILLVALAPTIIGTSMVRGIVLNQINSSALNGKLAIKDWSFGWTSGVHIEGVELTDADNAHLLSVAQIDVPISLLKAATGDIDLGETTIKGVDFNAKMDEHGQLNIVQAIKQQPQTSPAPQSNQPSKLPNIKGVIHLQDVTGTFEDKQHKLTANLPQNSPLNANVTIKDINQPIEEDADLGLQINGQNLLAVKSSGSVAAINNNVLDVKNVGASQSIELSGGDFAPISQILQANGLKLNVTGQMNGKINATVKTLNTINADVAINVNNLSAGGAQLQGDTLAFSSAQIAAKASLSGSDSGGGQISVDAPITLQAKGAGAPDKLTISANVPQDSLNGLAAAMKSIAARYTKSSAAMPATIPGSGTVKIDADWDVANLVNQVPHFAHLQQGMQLTSGTLGHNTTITIGGGKAIVATDTQLKNFQGTTNGTPVHLSDIDASAGLTAAGGDHPDVQDIKLGLSSAFANVTGGGATIGKISVKGTSDLKQVQDQISQVVDLDSLFHAPQGSHVSLAGAIGFDAHTDGDFTADDSSIGVGANLNAKGVNISIPGRRTINEPKFDGSVSATLHHTASQFVEAAHDLKLAAQSPAINFAAGGDVQMGGRYGVLIPSLKITQGSVDFRLAQEEFGGALSMFIKPPAAGQKPTIVQRIADNSVKVASGSANLTGEVRFDQGGLGFPQPLLVQVQPIDLTIVDDLGTAQTAHVPAAALKLSGSGTVSDQNVATIKDLTLSMTLGDASTPLLAMDMAADATVPLSGNATGSVQRLEMTKLSGNLPGLQSALAPLLPVVMPPDSAVPADPAPGGSAGAAQPSLIDQLASNTLVCTSGTLSGSLLASCDGKTITIQKPLTITIADLTVQPHNGATTTSPINDQTLSASVGGTVSQQDGGMHAVLNTLALQFGDQIKLQGDSQSPLDVTLDRSGAIGAAGAVQLSADLPKLINTGSLVLPPDQMASLRQLSGGQMSGTIQLQRAGEATKASCDLSLSGLTLGTILNNETFHIVAGAAMAGDLSAIHDVNVGIDSSFAKKISVSDGQVVLQTRQGDRLVPVGLFDKLQSIKVEADEVDLAKLDAIANLLTKQAAAAPPGGTTVVVVPPPQVTSGVATLQMNVTRSGNATTANISQATVHGLAMKNGSGSATWPKDISAQLSAQVDTRADATGQMPIADQLADLQVTALSVDTGIGTTIALKDNKPIVAQNFADLSRMNVQGGVLLDGDIAQAARIAEALGGKKPNSLPYSGHFKLAEAVAKDPSQPTLHLSGGGDITKFVVMGEPGADGSPAAPVFSEDDLAITNPLDFDFKSFSLIIAKDSPIAIALRSTGAAAVSFSGTVNDVLVNRQIADDNKIELQLSYDLAKLWPIIKPMLSPDTQQQLADLQIEGNQQRSFEVSGSYPVRANFADSIYPLKVSGSIGVDKVSTQGITVEKFVLPIDLEGGILRTQYAGRPAGANTAEPATCNGGTLDIGIATIDLRTNPMLLYVSGTSAAGQHYLMKDVSINAAMSKSFLGKFLNNPAFVNARQAQGLLSVQVDYVDHLPMSDLVMQSVPENKGRAELHYSARGLRIGNALFAVFGNDSVAADINNADVQFANGRVTEDTTMMIDGTKPLRFAGVVILGTKQFAPMTVYVPAALFRRLIPPNAMQYVPDQVAIPMKGDMNNPKIQLDKAISKILQEAAKKAIINNLLQGLGGHH